MPNCNENNLNTMYEKLNNLNLALYESCIDLWRIEEKCRLKVKSIEEIQKSTLQVNIENKVLEQKIHDVKSRIVETRDNIVNLDKISMTLYDTLAHLEVLIKKKEFFYQKSRREHELRLFVQIELWQKEEERINSLPEMISLKLADSELESKKLEYEELLVEYEHVVEKINKSKEVNNKEQNNIIVKFVTEYVKMQLLIQREENCKTRLRNLDEEFNKKLTLKNSLLITQQKKVTKMSFWIDKVDTQTFDVTLNSMKENLKTSLEHSDYKSDFYNQQKKVPKPSFWMDKVDTKTFDFKLNNKPKKHVTFCLPSDDQNHDNSNLNSGNFSNYKNTITHIVESDVPKISPDKNHFDGKDKSSNKDSIDFQNNKRKVINNIQPDFEFKKPYIPAQNAIYKNKNKICSKTDQPSVQFKNVHSDKTITENKEEIDLIYSSISKDDYSNTSCLENDNYLQGKHNSSRNEQTNLINPTSDNINIVDDLQYNGNSSSEHYNHNNLSGFVWNEREQPLYVNSENDDDDNDSFCGSDMSELFENSDSLSQGNSNATSALYSQESKMEENVQNPGNFAFKPFIDESTMKTGTESNKSMEETSRLFNNFNQSNQPNLFNSEKFSFNFN